MLFTTGETERDPAVALLPVHAPLAVQLVAPVVDHVRVLEPPEVIVVGAAFNVTVGADAAAHIILKVSLSPTIRDIEGPTPVAVLLTLVMVPEVTLGTIVYVVNAPGVTEYEPDVPESVIGPGLITHERPEAAQFVEATLMTAAVFGVHESVYVYVEPPSSNQIGIIFPEVDPESLVTEQVPAK